MVLIARAARANITAAIHRIVGSQPIEPARMLAMGTWSGAAKA